MNMRLGTGRIQALRPAQLAHEAEDDIEACEGQIVGDAVHPFDDAQAAREAAARLAEDVP